MDDGVAKSGKGVQHIRNFEVIPGFRLHIELAISPSKNGVAMTRVECGKVGQLKPIKPSVFRLIYRQYKIHVNTVVDDQYVDPALGIRMSKRLIDRSVPKNPSSGRETKHARDAKTEYPLAPSPSKTKP